jgi:hypothetical protein
MKNSKPAEAKIMVHGRGTGGVNDADIERRAGELASLAGRSRTPYDYARARRELQGQTLPDGVNEDAPRSSRGLLRDPSEPPSDTGRQIPERAAPDEEALSERLVEEGVEEAQHDQMIAARREERREDHA